MVKALSKRIDSESATRYMTDAVRAYCAVVESCEAYDRVELARECMAHLGRMIHAALSLPIVEPDEQTRRVLDAISDEHWLQRPPNAPTTLKGSKLKQWLLQDKRDQTLRRRRFNFVARHFPSALRRIRITHCPVEQFHELARRLNAGFIDLCIGK